MSAPVRVFGAQFQFVLQGKVGRNYIIEANTNLNVPDWFCLLVTNGVPQSSTRIVDSQATNRAGFYRALLGP